MHTPPKPPGPPHLSGPPKLSAELAARAAATFNSALERPTGERAVFVAGECAGDDELHRHVQRLLAAHDRAGGFLQEPPASTEFDEQLARLKPEEEGEQIGNYKLLQEIGEGGFGTVWMAQQMEPVSRKVALKIIKLGMDTREVIGRFEQERQALAMMDHPNIAKVFDAGATKYGRPYFVMELVKGIPITQYCDEKGLGTRERLALFGDVCSAIHHAHQKGIIHRDIKPSNVMVTLYADQPVVKVIDFGIAKATQGNLTDKTLFTRFEQFIGTPVYMSPEQAALSAVDIDTRSDIYALGVLLYELLVGKPPFDAKSLASAGYEEMRRIIREVEPVKPSSRISTIVGEERTQLAKAHCVEPEKLGRLVEPDLDWIVMKAIEKDRTRRYETANGLAQDIRRFLADEPVSATPPSAGYQFWKFARRNRVALRVAAGIAAVLVAATAVSTWQAIRATTAEKKTAETLTLVSAERDAKEVARKEAEAISIFLGEVFQSPDPTRDGRTVTVAETLDRAAKKLETDLASQPAQRAKLQGTLARTYHALGLYPQAISLEEKVLDYRLATSGREHYDTLEAMNHLETSYSSAGHGEKALKLREELLPLCLKVLGPEHNLTLLAMNDLAVSYFDSGRKDEALKLQEEVLALGRKLFGPEHPDTLTKLNNLASFYSRAGRMDEALKMNEELLALRLKVSGPDYPNTLKAMGNLAFCYFDAGRHDDALKLREKALPISRKVLGPEHPDTLAALATLALSYTDAHRWDDAIKLWDEFLMLTRKVFGPENGNARIALSNLSICYRRAGRKDEALKMQEEVMAIELKIHGPEHPDRLKAAGNLAKCCRDAGDVARADALDKEVLAAYAKQFWGERATDDRVTRFLAPPLQAKAFDRQLDGTWAVDLTELKDFADLSIFQGTPLSRLTLRGTAVSDLTPLRGLTLKQLNLEKTKVTDLSPLQGMPLEYLNLKTTDVSDISILRGMPLNHVRLIGCQRLIDLTPLAESKDLALLTLPPNARDIEFLRAFPKLVRLSFTEGNPQSWLPAQTVAEFWQEFDAKKK